MQTCVVTMHEYLINAYCQQAVQEEHPPSYVVKANSCLGRVTKRVGVTYYNA